MKAIKLIALDTSTDHLTLAIMSGENRTRCFHEHVGRNHSSLLMPMMDKLLKKSGLKAKDLDGFCVGIGPGSFTGLRIGVATVKGLAYALKKPIMAIPTLDIIAWNAEGHKKRVICPVLDAKKNKVYACLYRHTAKGMKRLSKYLLLSIEDLTKIVAQYKDVVFLGDAAPVFEVRKGRYIDWYPRAEAAVRLGLDMFRKKRFTKPEDLEPLYIYSSECDIKGI